MEWDSKIISILRGGIADRAAKRDAGAKAKSASLEKLERLRDNGLHLTVAEDIMQQVESGLFEVEKLMGRGDRGIQPVRWGDNPIVVQDPFLWEKVSYVTPVIVTKLTDYSELCCFDVKEGQDEVL